MDFTLVGIVAIICIAVVVWSIFYLNYLREIKNKEIDIKKFELYSKVNLTQAEDAIDKYIENKLNKYVTQNIVAKGMDYIREEDANKMVKDLSADIVISLSDLYIYYIKLLTTINTDDDLIKYVYDKVSDACTLFILDFNTPKPKA